MIENVVSHQQRTKVGKNFKNQLPKQGRLSPKNAFFLQQPPEKKFKATVYST